MKILGFDWNEGNWPKCGKHGLSKIKIERLFLEGNPSVSPDLKHSTSMEIRHIAVGQVDGRNMFVAFSFQGNFIRPISARYMHAKEVKNYEGTSP